MWLVYAVRERILHAVWTARVHGYDERAVCFGKSASTVPVLIFAGNVVSNQRARTNGNPIWFGQYDRVVASIST